MIRRLCLFVIAVRHKLHHRYVLSAMFGVSGPIVATTCFLLININDWSPEDAQHPVTASRYSIPLQQILQRITLTCGRGPRVSRNCCRQIAVVCRVVSLPVGLFATYGVNSDARAKSILNSQA
jgi:hypothetical protein